VLHTLQVLYWNALKTEWWGTGAGRKRMIWEQQKREGSENCSPCNKTKMSYLKVGLQQKPADLAVASRVAALVVPVWKQSMIWRWKQGMIWKQSKMRYAEQTSPLSSRKRSKKLHRQWKNDPTIIKEKELLWKKERLTMQAAKNHSYIKLMKIKPRWYQIPQVSSTTILVYRVPCWKEKKNNLQAVKNHFSQ